ncbi:MAG: hydrogenase nickel incorporation protein HypB [Actinobacteria bacterium]|nr:hydrogenase nickel incorporation protein HypB [Actinomycetota bacterium]
MSVITVERKILQKNDEITADIRSKLQSKNIFSLNLLSSPGSGKTTILEKTLEFLQGKISVGVVEGDVQTDNDARRIAKYGIPVVQIVTNGGCHLEAKLVADALENLDLDQIRLLFIENVGNLVCPASYDLGEDKKVVIVSTTEGDDKPVKYPKMFRVAQLCIINKMDLLPYLDFDVERFKENAAKINPDLQFFEVSAKTKQGIEEWVKWVVEQVD